MGFVIEVNGEKVWESEGEAILVDRVTVSTSHGEVTAIGSANLDDLLKIEVNSRDQPADQNNYLDLIDAEKAQNRRDLIEGGSADAVAEGRAEMEAEADDQETAEEAPAEEDKQPGDLEF